MFPGVGAGMRIGSREEIGGVVHLAAKPGSTGDLPEMFEKAGKDAREWLSWKIVKF